MKVLKRHKTFFAQYSISDAVQTIQDVCAAVWYGLFRIIAQQSSCLFLECTEKFKSTRSIIL